MTIDPWEALWNKAEPKPPPTTNGHVVDPARVGRWAARAFEDELERLRGAQNGTRNDTLNRAGYSLGQIVAGGSLNEDEVRGALRSTALSVGLDEREVDATIRSSMTSGMQEPRSAPEMSVIPDTYVIEAPDLDQHETNAFWAARPLLQHLHDYARARRVSPWAVLGVALARITTATPPHYVLPAIVGGQASLNLFVGLVGTSGSGKGAAESVAAEAVDVGFIETHKTGSGEGIAHGYMKRERGEIIQHTSAVLFSIPEIDTLTALGGRQGATLLPELRSAWSGERLGFGYADPTKRLPVPAHQYRLCLVAGIQPARAAGLLEDSDGGTPQRFLWLPASDPDAPTVPPGCPEPLGWEMPGYAHTKGFTTPSGRVVLGVCETARDIITTARLDRLHGNGEALDGHALLTQLKTAAALALADGRVDIGGDDWALADVIARKSAATRSAVAQVLQAAKAASNRGRAEAEASRAVYVGEKVEDAAVKRVAQAITRKLRREAEWVTATAVKKAVAYRERGYFNEAVERLLDAGQIEVEEAHTGGKKYRAIGVEK